MQARLPWSECPAGPDNVTVAECADSSETQVNTVLNCEHSYIPLVPQYFWFRTVLDSSGSIGELGGVKWWSLLCLLASWVLVYTILCRGIASSGKVGHFTVWVEQAKTLVCVQVVYFTALFPYLVLTIFFIRGITLPGAAAGLNHMFTPKMEKLLEPRVWLDAANQVRVGARNTEVTFITRFFIPSAWHSAPSSVSVHTTTLRRTACGTC